MSSSALDVHWRSARTLADVGPPQSLWRRHSDAANSAWLAARLPAHQPRRLLKTDLFDEALAPGLVPLLSDRSHQVIGVDVSACVLGAARARHPRLQSAVGDVRALPFGDGSFDAIVSNSTLDHFSSTAEISASLRELHRILRSNGVLLLTLDNLANPVIGLRNALPYRLLDALGLVPYPMGATCGPRRLRGLVSSAAFEVAEVGALLHCPRVLAVALARILERYGSARSQARFLAAAMRFERLAAWPTRFVSGHFIGVVAIKR